MDIGSVISDELAIYSLDSPQTVKSGRVRRPKYSISEDLNLRVGIWARIFPRWAVVIPRQSYSEASSNRLLHQSIISSGYMGDWRFLSLLLVFLKCSANNRSDTVIDSFFPLQKGYDCPSRVRSNRGGENSSVWELTSRRTEESTERNIWREPVPGSSKLD